MLATENSLELDFRSIRSAIRVTTAPTDEPITVAEAKAACKYSADNLDDDFRAWIATARELIEAQCSRALITQSCKLYMSRFPSWDIELHKCPVASVESVQYYDTSGTLQTWSSSYWQANVYREPAIVCPVYGQTWPTAKYDTENAVIVSFTAGYGQAPAVPQLARQAIKMLVAHWWSNPEAFGQIDDQIGPTFDRCMRLLSWGPYA